jgi:hypothetical protein
MRDNSAGCFMLLKKFLKSYALGRSTLFMSQMTQVERDAIQTLLDLRNRIMASDDYPFERDANDAEGGI